MTDIKTCQASRFDIYHFGEVHDMRVTGKDRTVPMRLRAWPALTAAALACICGAAPAQDHSTPHWGYHGQVGPQHWATLDRNNLLCGLGRFQSPIDIRNEQVRGAGLEPIHFDYRSVPLKVVDNGHTVQLKYDPGSFIGIGARRYELKQVHFHMPSEERIDGRAYPMVAHLVHRNDAGGIAVVAVLLVEGAANALFETILDYVPPEPGVERTALLRPVNASALLPPQKRYFTFMGSLTTPPCSEGVIWIVMQQPVEVSHEQLARFSRLYSDNARPPQPVNGRLIRFGG
jgi:carbonic anhydrase